jgi:hypothetical protein
MVYRTKGVAQHKEPCLALWNNKAGAQEAWALHYQRGAIPSHLQIMATSPVEHTVHPVFHASLLTPYIKTKEHRENYSRPPPDMIEGEEQYKVKAICAH